MGQAVFSSGCAPVLELSEVPARSSAASSTARPSRTILELATHEPRWERLLRDEDGLFTGMEIIDELYGQHLLEMIEIMERYDCSFKQAAALAATGDGEGNGSRSFWLPSSQPRSGVGDYLKARRAGFPLFQALTYGVGSGEAASCAPELFAFRREEVRDALTRCQLVIRLVEATLERSPPRCSWKEASELEAQLAEARGLCFRLDHAVGVLEEKSKAVGESWNTIGEYQELAQVAAERNSRLLELTEELRELRGHAGRVRQLASDALAVCVPIARALGEAAGLQHSSVSGLSKRRVSGGSSPYEGAADMHQRGALLREYSVGPTIGEGAYGVVASCRKRATREEFAVKLIDKVETPMETIVQEIEMLQSIDHTNVVKFVGVFHEKCFVCIVMTKYAGGDLVRGIQRHYQEQGRIGCYASRHLMSQMGASVRYLHSRCVIHRDIKGDNFLMDRQEMLDPSCRVALSDFGTARWAGERDRLSEEVGTKMFWAPEMFRGDYGLKVDVWATGVVLFGLLSGHFPFRDESEISSKEVQPIQQVDPACQDLIRSMVRKEEDARPSAEQVMLHHWFACEAFGLPRDLSGMLRSARSAQLLMDEPNVHVKERRQELIHRLNMEHHLARGAKERGTPGLGRRLRSFCVEEAGVTTWYEWWDRSKCKQRGVLDAWERAEPSRDPWFSQGQDAADLGAFTHMLEEHNVDPSAFGAGSARTLRQLADEVQSGTAELLLDASEHKKLVRVVNIVVLRLYPSGTAAVSDIRLRSRLSSAGPGVAAQRPRHVLAEREERFADGRRRENLRLPGSKKEPWENTRQTAERIIRETLHLDVGSIQLDLAHVEADEAQRESPSYPGLQTVYRQEFVTGTVLALEPRATLLPEPAEWTATDASGSTRLFSWMHEQQALAGGAKLWPDHAGKELSGLVKAPVGLAEEELSRLLTKWGVDVQRFGSGGARTLKEFSDELLRGEAMLAHGGPAGLVARVVNLAVVALERPATGSVLVAARRHPRSREADSGSWLPGAVGRPDESHFHSARRLICGQLLFDENMVHFERDVQDVEEVESLPEYPGLRTVYRRRLVRATLREDESRPRRQAPWLPCLE